MSAELPKAAKTAERYRISDYRTAVGILRQSRFAAGLRVACSICKPFDRERLLISVDRAMRFLDRRQGADRGEYAAPEGQSQPWLSRVTIKSENGIVFVPVEDILWIEAANKYVIVHARDGLTHIARQTIQNLEETLDPAQFVRIHRSVLVRKSAVRGLHPLFHGDYVVKLATGAELTLSRSFREAFFRQMGR